MNLLIEEILNQIKHHKTGIIKIKEETFKDEISIENDISRRTDPKINTLQLEITEKSKMIDELNKKIKEFEIQSFSKEKSKILSKKSNDINNDKTKRINKIVK